MNHVKKLIRTALVSAALSAVLVVGASAAGIGVATVYDNGLRLRAEASLNSNVLATASKNEKVTVLEDAGNNWYRVSYQGQEGYMSGAYLIINWNEDSTTISSAEESEGSYGRVTASSLNVRAAASTSSEKVGSLACGSIVEILDEQDGWYQIVYQNSTAWASADYVTAGVDPNQVTVGQQVVDLAMQYLGCKYVYGASGPTQFDCSGFTSYVYGKLGYSLNRSAAGQTQNGTYVSRDQLQVGDLVLFRQSGSTKAASHVGIYIGNDQFIHASTNDYQVRIDNLSSPWYASIYIGGRHIA
jgi:cell wall-associated NlpC family hydrolase